MFTNQQIINTLIQCFENERYTNLSIENIHKMSADDMRAMVTILKAIFDCQVSNPKASKAANTQNIKEIYNNRELKQVFYNIHASNKQSTHIVYEKLRQQLNINNTASISNYQQNLLAIEQQINYLSPQHLTNLKPKYQQFKLLLYVGLFDITTSKFFMQQINIRPEKDICYVMIFHQLKQQSARQSGQIYYQCPLTPKTEQDEVIYINGKQIRFVLDGEYQIIKLDQIEGNYSTYQFDVECLQYEIDHRSHKQFCSIYLAKQMNFEEFFDVIFKRQLYLPAPMYKFLERENYLQIIQVLSKTQLRLLEEQDDDIEVSAFKLIPICSLTKSIIQFPVIGKNCQHWLVCMDLNTYLSKNENKCYICGNQTKYEDLIVHALFYYIVDKKISMLVINQEGELQEVATQQDEELSQW